MEFERLVPSQLHHAKSWTREVVIRAHQIAPRLGDLDSNLRMIEEAICDAIRNHVQLLVLPELATSGYYLESAEAEQCAITAKHPVFETWASLLPPETVVVVGFCERDEDEIFNSAAVLSDAGLLAVYRKTHLWDEELSIFNSGNAQPPVVDTPVGMVGVLICYDLEFPEMPRGLALRGAEIVAVPTNWPLVPRPTNEHPPEVIQAMAAARASRVAIVCCDRTGTERGHIWTGGTSIIGYEGWITGAMDATGSVDATIIIPEARTRIGPRNDVLADRQPNLY